MLKDWIEEKELDCEIVTDGVVDTPLGLMIEIKPDIGEALFNANFELNVSSKDANLALQSGAEYYLFEFGGQYYYTPMNNVLEPQLIPFKYIGESINQPIDHPFLGVHGRYELMSGTRDYADWCMKAKFYGIKTLGICEHSTLAGTLPFQMACNDAGIKSIIGATYTVQREDFSTYDVKLYALSKKGWKNLLRINKQVNIDNRQDRCVSELGLDSYSEDLVCVLTPGGKHPLKKALDKLKDMSFTKLYVQFDVSEMLSNDRDREKLVNLQRYLKDDLYLQYFPILIHDAYYLDKEDGYIREILTNAGKVKSAIASHDQYFKHTLTQIDQLDELFEDEAMLKSILKQGIRNCRWIANNTDFTIEVGKRHLPKFEMTAALRKQYSSNEELFLDLIEKGVQEKLSGYNSNVVRERLNTEIEVITDAGVQDYFLILWDIIEFCKSRNIITGVGRGSAGGCLISYLLGIIKVNPLDFDLLFERFLNKGRAMKSLPDIDTDFPGKRRGEVKEYMEEKYGHNFVASVGTFTTLQMRAAMKELNRAIGSTNTGTMNYVSQIFDGEKWSDLFEEASRKPQLKDWVRDNVELVNSIPLCFNSPKSQSIHACATIIVPKGEDDTDTIFTMLPMRCDDEGNLVTEWEGGLVEAAGFLKEDILGIKQLDKISMIFDLVKEHENVDLDLESIPLDDQKVFELFQKGYAKDVFHFGSEKLSNYLRIVQPYSIQELINSIALFRPGAMASNAHMDYVKMKNGEKEPEYDYLLEDVTRETFGLYIFQEQVMKACQVLGGFDLAEADDIRKAMGKKKLKLLQTYRQRFLDSAVEKGCDPQKAADIWQKLEMFAGYGFNKSHAAAYAITGYTCNWLKAHYPTQFWVTALQYAKDEEIPGFVNEIHKTGHIEILPPDINTSNIGFVADYDQEKIFWSITKIKFVGASAVEHILEEREKNGKFFSMEEFLERVEKKKVNKRAITNMIVAGCFDKMYSIESPKDRVQILKEFYQLRKEKEKDYAEWLSSDSVSRDWFWTLKQHEASGLGDMSYKKALQFAPKLQAYTANYVDPDEFYAESSHNKYVVVGGIISEVKEKKTKKGMMGDITLDNNAEPIKIRVWAQQWEGDKKGYEGMREKLLQSKGKILFVSGKVAAPSQWNPDNILQTVGDPRKTVWDVL